MCFQLDEMFTADELKKWESLDPHSIANGNNFVFEFDSVKPIIEKYSATLKINEKKFPTVFVLKAYNFGES